MYHVWNYKMTTLLLLLFVQQQPRMERKRLEWCRASSMRNLHNAPHNVCALGRTFFFSSHEKSERWFAMEAKEKELRRRRPGWSAIIREKVPRSRRRPRRSKGKGIRMHRDARNSAPRRETRLRLVEKRDYISTFRVESRWIIYFAPITWNFRGNYDKKEFLAY